MTVAARDTVARHGPEEGMESSGLLAEEVPSIIMCGGRLWNFVVGGRLDGMDQIGELSGVVDEEDGNIVANHVKISLENEPSQLLVVQHSSTVFVSKELTSSV